MRHSDKPVVIDLSNPERVKEQRRNVALYGERRQSSDWFKIVGGAAMALGLLILVGRWTAMPVNPMVAVLVLLCGGVLIGSIGGARLRCPNCDELRHDEDADSASLKAWKAGRCPKCGWFVSDQALRDALPPKAPARR